jgi:hypothetical protein
MMIIQINLKNAKIDLEYKKSNKTQKKTICGPSSFYSQDPEKQNPFPVPVSQNRTPGPFI